MLDMASLGFNRCSDLDPIVRHKKFRLFACMNPATDVGKKELPPGIRNRYAFKVIRPRVSYLSIEKNVKFKSEYLYSIEIAWKLPRDEALIFLMTACKYYNECVIKLVLLASVQKILKVFYIFWGDRFTEFYVGELEETQDLKILVSSYLQGLSLSADKLEGIVQ